MIVGIHNLSDRGATFHYQEKAEDFPLLAELVKKDECRFSFPVDINLTIQPVGGMFHVTGRLNTVVSLSCSRCLASIDFPVKEDFLVIYTKEVPDMEPFGNEGEVELKAEDMGVILFSGDEIDFREMIQEQLLLALPYRPLCGTACKGLCPQCGADLNNGACGCPREAGDSRFAVLKNLKLE
jgi:uncharacterized protein